jgi:hypothetical protein
MQFDAVCVHTRSDACNVFGVYKRMANFMNERSKSTPAGLPLQRV